LTITIIALFAAVAGAVLFLRSKLFSPPKAKPIPDRRFDQQNITHTFISAIPTLTREMNLEVATSRQTEVLERKHSHQFLGLDLGTNFAQIKVPVTYRYHIRLFDPWKLEIAGRTLLVRSPAIQCSLPPGIHTDLMQQECVRGWARLGHQKLLEELQHDLTPILSSYASDPRRMELVRETCRAGVAEFIKRWLDGEQQWGAERFTAIVVGFSDEPALPSRPSLHVDFQ
jgi:hypothetical protein